MVHLWHSGMMRASTINISSTTRAGQPTCTEHQATFLHARNTKPSLLKSTDRAPTDPGAPRRSYDTTHGTPVVLRRDNISRNTTCEYISQPDRNLGEEKILSYITRSNIRQPAAQYHLHNQQTAVRRVSVLLLVAKYWVIGTRYIYKKRLNSYSCTNVFYAQQSIPDGKIWHNKRCNIQIFAASSARKTRQKRNTPLETQPIAAQKRNPRTKIKIYEVG